MNLKASFQAVVKGVQVVVDNVIPLSRRLLLPFFIYAVICVLDFYFFPVMEFELGLEPEFGRLIAYGIGFFLLYSITYVIVSVATHRLLIIGPRADKPNNLRFLGREWQFALACIWIFFYTIPAWFLTAVPYVGELLAIGVAYYIISRLSLVFPSIAIDAPMNVYASWQATSNYQLVMFTIVFVYSAFFWFLEWGLVALFKPEGVYVVLFDIFSLLTVVFTVAALSETYRQIMQDIERD